MDLLILGNIKFLKIVSLLLIFSTGLYAQNLVLIDMNENIVTADTIEVVFHPGPDHGWTELKFEVLLKNISIDTIEVGLKKNEFTKTFDEYHSFCFGGNCVDSSTHISPYHAIIPPGKTDSSFSGHFRFDDLLHVPNNCLVSYTFYNINNPSDSAFVYVNYNTLNQLGIHDNDSSNIFLSDAWPNPVNEMLIFNYRLINTVSKLPTYMILLNASGKCLHKQILTQNIGSISINTIDWKAGIYYYFILCGNVISAYKKCLIMH